MKKFLLSIAVLCMISFAASAQTKYYKGEWTKAGTTYLYKGFVKLEFSSGGIVQGRIIWTIIKANSLNETESANYKGKMNKSGIELIEGDYNAETKDLKFSGMDKIDPAAVIGVDTYTLKISSDNKTIYGKTDANGSGNGCFYAVLQNDVTAKKEFDLLAGKIK